jgi:oxygen-independent coproporphyrinogen-3 oxidase
LSPVATATQRPRLVGVYVHLPYCDVKCAYCDFYSIASRHVEPLFWQNYLSRLKDDLTIQLGLLAADVSKPVLASVFFGGGTPSKAPAHVIAGVVEAIRSAFPHALCTPEITAEANPESLSHDLLKAWREAGVNRVSVGMQSLDEATLRYLGRLYRPQAYQKVLSLIRSAGFHNYSADFITGVPGQSVASTLRDLQFAMDEGVTHLSLYQLTIEPGTLLRQRILRGERAPINDQQQAEQMASACEYLSARGFARYEISNFARPGYACLHNRIYWTYRPYLGLGVAAHSFSGRRRFLHPRSLDKYLEPGMPPAEDSDSKKRDALLGLIRLLVPFRPERITALYGHAERHEAEQVLERAVERGWLMRKGHLLQLTSAGAEQSDSLLTELWNIR